MHTSASGWAVYAAQLLGCTCSWLTVSLPSPHLKQNSLPPPALRTFHPISVVSHHLFKISGEIRVLESASVLTNGYYPFSKHLSNGFYFMTRCIYMRSSLVWLLISRVVVDLQTSTIFAVLKSKLESETNIEFSKSQASRHDHLNLTVPC